MASLPEGATSFTTIELKCNYLGTAREGLVECLTTAVHLGRTTQVWDATVRTKDTERERAPSELTLDAGAQARFAMARSHVLLH